MPRSRGALSRAHMSFASLVVAVTLCATLATAAHAAVVPTPAAERYGMNASNLLDAPESVRLAGWKTLHDGGVRLIRIDFSWCGIESRPPSADGVHTYDWSRSDDRISELARAGLRAYPMIGTSALWAALEPGNPVSRPRDPAQFATFAAAAVARYGQGGSFWAAHPELPQLPVQSVELWNEPNAAMFWHEQAGAAADYAQLYLTARTAIQQVAPSTEVVAGGLVASTAASFLSGMLAAQPTLRDNLDAIAYHPYLMDPATAVSEITGLRRILDSAGATQSAIEITEVGWSLLDASEQQRGENFATLSRLTAAPALRVTRIIPYAALSAEKDPTSWGDWFGLLNQDGSAKPAFIRWSQEIARLGQPPAVLLPAVASTVTNAVTSITAKLPAAKAGHAPSKSSAAKAKAARAKKAKAKKRAARTRAAKARAARARTAKARAARTRAAKARAARTRTAKARAAALA